MEVVLFSFDPIQEGLINGEIQELELLVEANPVEGPEHLIPYTGSEIVWKTTW